ncbi:MAG: hypothetical protein GX567_11755, partial [Clostridia bacterium]|nr:hypothetical protein [Clostridia bacterium]
VTYSYIEEGSSTENKILADSEIPGGSVISKKLIHMYTNLINPTSGTKEYIEYVVVWDAVESRLYYEQYTLDDTGARTGTVVSNARMADYITSFSADITRLESKRIVGLNMMFEKGSQNYSSDYNITIRNKIVVNVDPGTIAPPIVVVLPEAIEVLPEVVVDPGTTYVFTANKIVNGAPSPATPEDVRWYIENSGSISPGTSIDSTSGKLTISKAETLAEITVRVVSRKSAAIYNVSTVKVRRVKSVGIAFEKTKAKTAGTGADQLEAGDEFTLTATVAGEWLDEELTAGVSPFTSVAALKEIDWENEGDAFSTYCTSSLGAAQNILLCKMNASIPNNIPIKKKAVARISKTAYHEEVFAIWEGLTYFKSSFVVEEDSRNLERGGREVFKLNFIDGPRNPNYIYLYDINVYEEQFSPETGDPLPEYKKLTGYPSSDFIAMAGGETNIAIQFPQYLKPYHKYRIDIQCFAFPKKPGEGRNTYYLEYNGYKREEASEASAIVSVYLDHSNLIFDGDPKITRKVYTPREFSRNLNNKSEKIYNFYNPYITNMRDAQAQYVTWKLYQFTGTDINKAQEKDFKEYNAAPSHMFDLSGIQGNTIKLGFYKNSWNNNVPDRLYLLPTVRLQNYTHTQTENAFYYKSYVEFINHNITLPKYKGNGLNLAEEKAYFPYPGSDDFSKFVFKDNGVSGQSEVTGDWECSYKFQQRLGYKIVRTYVSNNGETVASYKLFLYINGNSLKTYTITEGATTWTAL